MRDVVIVTPDGFKYKGPARLFFKDYAHIFKGSKIIE